MKILKQILILVADSALIFHVNNWIIIHIRLTLVLHELHEKN